jgi:hypothetical protein
VIGRRGALRRASSSLALAAAAWALGGEARAELTARANHDRIEIGFAYHGSTVSVRGEADDGVDLVVKISSPDGRQVLKKKGKVAGLLWMNVGPLELDRAPDLYEVFSTKPLEEILAPEERLAHVIGYDALERHVEVTPAASAEERATWFREFVAMKEDSRLYTESSGRIATERVGAGAPVLLVDAAVRPAEGASGRQRYSLETEWPHQARPGAYTVTVFAVKEGKVREQATATVHVEQVGAVKLLASMARERSVLYALVSIGIALSAGFGVGMVLRKGGGSH